MAALCLLSWTTVCSRANIGDTVRIKPVAEFAINAEAYGIILPLTLGGAEYHALLDTGSLGHFLDENLSSRLGPARPGAEGKTPAGYRMFEQRELPGSLHIAGLLPGAGTAALFDTAPFTAAAGVPMAGTLGLALMRQHTWIFDFDSGKLTAGDRLDPRSPNAAGAPESSLLHLPVEFSSQVAIPFMLDTGASGWGTLEAELFDALAQRCLLRVLPQKVSAVTSAGTVEDVSQGEMRGLKLNGYQLPPLALLRSDQNRLGWKVFSQFNWTFDLSRSEVTLRPRQKTPLSGGSLRTVSALTTKDTTK